MKRERKIKKRMIKKRGGRIGRKKIKMLQGKRESYCSRRTV